MAVGIINKYNNNKIKDNKDSLGEEYNKLDNSIIDII
jgi:hypothetical protein